MKTATRPKIPKADSPSAAAAARNAIASPPATPKRKVAARSTAVPRKIRPAASGTAPGRRHAAVSARAALIAAAIAGFSRDGFAGARVDEMANAAGVNKQLVYHYFMSKEGLYLAALESVYAEIRDKERKLHLGALEPLDAMTKLVGFSFDYLAQHPEFIALLVDENRNRGSHILASESLRKMHSPFIALLEDTLERGIACGVFRHGLDAIDLYISIAGISFFFFSNNHTLSAIFGKSLASRGALAQRRRHVIEFALNALRL